MCCFLFFFSTALPSFIGTRRTETGLRHSVVRAPSFRESRERVRLGDTVPKSLATVLEKRLLLHFTGMGSEIQIRHLHRCQRQKCRGHAAGNDTLPFSMNFCFRSSSELQGEVEPT